MQKLTQLINKYDKLPRSQREHDLRRHEKVDKVAVDWNGSAGIIGGILLYSDAPKTEIVSWLSEEIQNKSFTDPSAANSLLSELQ